MTSDRHWRSRTPMLFYLRYRGRLPAVSQGNPRTVDKHNIRLKLSPQLKDWWTKHPELKLLDLDRIEDREIKGGRVQHPSTRWGGYYYSVKFGKDRFIPLVIKPMEYVCELDIQFLRREVPGHIVHGGDLDNRIKTLFDALRIPLNHDEIPKDRHTEDGICYCLLEDDALITDLNIRTGLLLGPLDTSEDKSDVDLTIKVLVKIGMQNP